MAILKVGSILKRSLVDIHVVGYVILKFKNFWLGLLVRAHKKLDICLHDSNLPSPMGHGIKMSEHI